LIEKSTSKTNGRLDEPPIHKMDNQDLLSPPSAAVFSSFTGYDPVFTTLPYLPQG
jgi:hypothetical protein